MDLLPLFQWFEASAIGDAIRSSLWLFPAIECVHLLGLTMLGGAVIVVNLRLLGWMLGGVPTSDVARDAYRYAMWGIVLMLATGIPLFLSEAVKCYYSNAFWVKILTLVPAMIYTATWWKTVAMAAEGGTSPARRGLTALASLALWFTVAAGGRWIGFS